MFLRRLIPSCCLLVTGLLTPLQHLSHVHASQTAISTTAPFTCPVRLTLPRQMHKYYSPSPWSVQVIVNWWCAVKSPASNIFIFRVFNPARQYGDLWPIGGTDIGASLDAHRHIQVHSTVTAQCSGLEQYSRYLAAKPCTATTISIAGTFSGDETVGDLTLVIGSTTYRIHITAQVRRAEAIAYAEQVFAALQRHDWQTVCGFVDPDDVLLAKEDFLVHDFQTYWPRITTRGLGTFGQQNVFGM